VVYKIEIQILNYLDPQTMNKIGNYRWLICGMVFFATTVNYLDRAVISLLKTYLEKDFNWSETDYGNLVIAFQLSYAIGMLGVGRVIDKIGTKLGYALSSTLWSVAAMAHALATSTLGFGIARSFLGITEAGNFPSAIKAVAEWFPKRERALATGIFNSGANIGAIIAPLTVPIIAETWGWQWAFILTGAVGFIWLVLWMLVYESPAKSKRLSKAEFDYIHSDDVVVEEPSAEDTTTGSVSWFRLLGFKQTWAFVVGKFMTDPVWWFYLFWLPAFLKAQYGLEKTQVALPIALVYTISMVGSVYGGYLPLYLIKKGASVFRSRKMSMLIYAFAAIPVVTAQYLGSLNMWLAIAIIGLACAAHAAWSANIFTTVSDMFPKKTVASITGMGGMSGALGGVLISKVGPALFEHYKALGHIQTGYYIMFFICGLAYIAAWGIMHLLVPQEKEVIL
jgi:MFS transporter, ACS family, hexuronate transporter